MSNMLENQVKALVARHFGISPSKVRMDDSFICELGGDALDLVELGWEIEAAFDVALTPGVRDSLVSCRAVVEWLKEYGTPRRGCRQDGEGGEQQAYDSKGGGRRQQAYDSKGRRVGYGRMLAGRKIGTKIGTKKW